MKKIILPFLLLVCILQLLWWTLSYFLGTERIYNDANTHYQSASFDTASQQYKIALARNAHLFELWHNQGNSLYQQDNFNGAIAAYEQALEISSDPETQKNLEFVKALVTQQASESSSESSQESSEEATGSETNHSEEDSSDQSSDESRSQTGEQTSENTLTDSIQQALEARIQDIEEAQNDLQKYYQREIPEHSNDLFETIFDNSALRQGGKKDW